MKWRFIVVFIFFLFIIFLFHPWGIGPSGLRVFKFRTLIMLLIPLAFPIVSVLAIVFYQKMVLAIPCLFYIIAFFFGFNFQIWASKVETMFWYWTGAVFACLFAIVSIIFIEIYRIRGFTFLNKIIVQMIHIIGLVSNIGIILWVTFIIIAWQSGA
ncbi:hypothetical protein CON22_24925 [Bacillus cereus]|nr:hypothetical protein CON22_24925 [Bacillus cereus]